MRNLLAFVLMIALVGSAAAYDLGNVSKETKSSSHVLMNLGTPDTRQGGETMDDAVVIPGLPYDDTGNTANNIDDYDVACSSSSTSPDVVYSYTPAADVMVSIDLCGSAYDTKVYVIDGDLNVIDCNDDFYGSGDPCGQYVSYLEGVALTGGTEYFIIVDGWLGDAGDYILAVDEFTPPPPCNIAIDDDEGEPTVSDNYVDLYNSGCNDDSGLRPFQELIADDEGNLTFSGQSAYYIDGGNNSRDTDWFVATLGETGVLEWTMDAEQETYGFQIAPMDCDDEPAVALSFLAGPCDPGSLTIQGAPGDLVWLWIGASTFEPPSGFVGNEYNYIAEFSGLIPGPVATESVSFDGIKSLYR